MTRPAQISALTCLLLLSFSSLFASAVEPNDTTTKELNEVVVEGRTQRAVKNGVEYIPGKKMKKMAMDATHLLAQMMIPSLRSNPGTGQVTSLDGREISYFIDYVPAEDRDLAGMRTEDVLRVEVLDHPEDPRFNGAAKVINFIMQKYEWGGYTKLSGQGTFVSTEFWSGSVYSRFVKGKLTYDVSVNTRGMHNKNNQYSTDIESYKDIQFQGKHYDLLERILHTGDNYLRRYNSTDGVFRLTYNNTDMLIRHAVYLTDYNNFERNSSSISFTDNVLPSSFSHTGDKKNSLSPMISGRYQFYLPKSNTLTADWSFRYDRLKGHRNHVFGNGTPIINDNEESNYSPNIGLSYSKFFNHNNSLNISAKSSNSIYNTDYKGSYIGKQDIVSSNNSFDVGYYQGWPFGLNVYAQVGATYIVNKVGGKTELNKVDPKIGGQIQYVPNQKNYLNFTAYWMRNRPGASTTNSVLIQENELLWLEGNPSIRNTKVTSISADYSFLPVNWFDLYANLSYFGEADRPIADFITLPGYDGVVRRAFDDGNKNVYRAIVSASFKLLNQSLTFNITGEAQRVEVSGINNHSWQWLSGSVSASYYLKNFMFSLSYSSPEKAVYGDILNDFNNNGPACNVRVTYSVGNFKASLFCFNWFEKYQKMTAEYDSPQYSYLRTKFDRAQMLSLNLSYTFTYGKKVKMTDEAYGAGQAKSAVLK